MDVSCPQENGVRLVNAELSLLSDVNPPHQCPFSAPCLDRLIGHVWIHDAGDSLPGSGSVVFPDEGAADFDFCLAHFDSFSFQGAVNTFQFPYPDDDPESIRHREDDTTL